MNENKLLCLAIGIVFLGISLSVISLGSNVKENSADKRFDKCIDLVNKAIPNPNETLDRSNFIKLCYEDTNE